MSLVGRKPRPLSRGIGSFRDDRLFIIACDDTYAPKQYFNFFKISRVQIHVVETTDGTSAAPQVLERLLEVDHEEDDELWMLLDVDHCGQGRHLQSFMYAIADAKRKGVNVALSKPCFELWLLLHHIDESQAGKLGNAKDVERALRKSLGEYNKTRLKQEHFPLASVCEAYKRAANLDRAVKGGDIPASNTTRVYKIWKSIVDKALPSQLPEEILAVLAPSSPPLLS